MSFPMPSIPGLNDNKVELREKENKGRKVVFQFNPETISFSKRATYREGNVAAGDAPVLQYASSSAAEISSIPLLLDSTGPAGLTFDKIDIPKEIGKLWDWLTPDDDERHYDVPVLELSWGKFKIGPYSVLDCYLASLSVNYTLFERSGKPLRAECTIGVKQRRLTDKRQNPTSGGPEPVRSYTAQRDDPLPLISHREYGDAHHWREIAAYNDVDNPFLDQPGRTMLLPEMRAT